MEKKVFIECYNNFFNSISNFSKYIMNLKKDIITNYNMYREIFINDFSDYNLYKILDFIRKNMVNKMLVKCDNFYREYDLETLKNDSDFFKVTSKPQFINEEMDNLNKEYNNLKRITNIEEYLNQAIIIFQKFVKIHPYKDGNGRTSRFLLDIMLLNRDILPPILYNSNYDRVELDNCSHEYTIRNNSCQIINFIKNKIGLTNEEFNIK